ncbi:hypothetical protein KI427_14110 [Rhodococcus ruber]|uniref:hypothetical protein n=1 Tax=Rhodococcus TaxID=1827 RepID=UPI0013C4B938|nr:MULTISPECIES: hypothetical protein [Rhodococcus]UQB70808.1 hypothetical protein KI427_14110 [Rhodococcus ruber]WML65455.1 hypothetical protein QNA09_12050 [Rhodococcus sp. AH-ZY2]
MPKDYAAKSFSWLASAPRVGNDRDMGLHLQLGEKITPKGRTLTVTDLDVVTLTELRPLLIGIALSGGTIHHSALIKALELPHATNGLGRVLDLLSEDCRRRREPSLAALVVSQSTGEVGSAFWGNPSSERTDVYKHRRDVIST